VSTVRPLRLLLGLRLGIGHDRQIHSRTEGFLKEIERLEKEHPIPLYWNFPVAPVLEKQSHGTANLVEAIRRRVRAGEDRIIPGGFTGAPHPLLLPEELQRELKWCYRNPWFPALKDLFDADPEVILPAYPDLFSEAAEHAYSRHGFTTIGVPIPLYRFARGSGKNRWTQLRALAASEYSIRGAKSGAKQRPVAVLRPGEITQQGIDALFTACGKADTLCLMLDLSGDSAGPEAVRRLLSLVSRQRRIEFKPFSAGTRKSTPARIDPAELIKFIEPAGRCPETGIWQQIETSRRRKRKSNLQTWDLLKTVAATVPSGSTRLSSHSKTKPPETIEITNISMAGSVTLIGVGVQATFREGRLTNLIDQGKRLLPGKSGQSVFTFGNKRELLQTHSAFSFDREGQTGMRSVLSTRIGRERETVQVVLDYYFADEHNWLTLEVTAIYPSLPSGTLTESTPLELCLCSFTEDDPPALEVDIPHREAYRQSVTPGAGVFLLWGKSFRLQRDNLSVELLAAPSQNTRSEPIEFRVEKPRGSAYFLWVNLGGSYLPQPAERLSARKLHLSYGIRFSGAAGKSNTS
jgi:hypothetical protein